MWFQLSKDRVHALRLMCRPHTKHTTDPQSISDMTTVPFILLWGVLANRYRITLHAIAVAMEVG